LPVVDALAGEYRDDVTFLAVAGRSSLDATTAGASQLLPSGDVAWVLDESIWETYEVFGQPVTFAISAGGAIVDSWFGTRPESEIRGVLDVLAGTST
jgi:hypothetical protein